MSLTFTMTGKSSVLAVSYFPAVDLVDGDYELGLTDFETYYTLANVNSTNNKFYYDSKEIVIPDGRNRNVGITSTIKKDGTLFAVIDCSRQNESVKSATVDVRIEFDCKENVPANTTAYCLIIHDRVIEYCPVSNVVRKIM
ncbi:hypothetical protein ALC57_02547 [Trachymyrmex cornetzi]|uniref:Double jelly roll-like domain-containing protein n=1 Tax=Trachymyrmex cornetzi TaxID=471704 RepID=A0A151JNV5_9HYME|nr:hypothetical protein ALC57_02547 [Trachymyrmex cornetzi]